MVRHPFVLLAMAGAACSPPNIAGGPLSSTNTGEALGQACDARDVLQSEPELMAWDPTARASLAAVRGQGVAVVRYEGHGCTASLSLLGNCFVPGIRYDFVSYPEDRSKSARNMNELYAALPIGGAELSSKLSGNRELRTDYMLAGYAQIPIGMTFQRTDLRGECVGATHIVSRIYLGGFAMVAGEQRAVEAESSFFLKLGARSNADLEDVAHGGNPEACKRSVDGRTEEAGCSVPLRLALVSLADAHVCLEASDCEQRCAQNQAVACVQLGWMQLNKRPPLADASARNFRKACELGFPDGCAALGKAYLYGQGAPQDAAAAANLLNQACERGVSMGCAYAGEIYERGLIGPVNLGFALSLFDRACDLGDVGACAHSATQHAAACNAGGASSCYRLAAFAEAGRGVAQDYPTSLRYAEKACALGLLPACTSVGMVLHEGAAGVAANLPLAVQTFRTTCERNEPRACEELGFLYFAGDGVPKDLSKAVDYTARACAGNVANACDTLGNSYENGEGVNVDLPRAIEFYRSACDAGSPESCASLGRLYERGKGVPLDAAEARKFYQQACAAQRPDACRAYERLGGR